jgi:hypothetical protein
MRKAIARLDAEQREALVYLTDLGISSFSAALVVVLLKSIVDLVLGPIGRAMKDTGYQLRTPQHCRGTAPLMAYDFSLRLPLLLSESTLRERSLEDI